MATKQEVADYINNIDLNTALNDTERAHIQERIDPYLAQTLIKIVGERAHIQERIDPYLAQTLIKIVGDVSWLVEIRENLSNND